MKTIAFITLVNILAIQILAQDNFTWPNNARAAVCLTYDDGLDCHLDTARVDLNQYNLKGSFYCPGKSESLFERMEDWRTLVEKESELGSHSLFHPCEKAKKGRKIFAWITPEYDLANYTVEQIITELTVANTLLKAVDGKEKRTYAYTCSDYKAGGENFSNQISHLYTGARAAGSIPESIKDLNLYRVPSWAVVDPSIKELIAYIEQAAEKGTLAVFMFHGVGANHMRVSREAHKELLAYLTEHSDRFWVATFSDIIDYIRTKRGY